MKCPLVGICVRLASAAIGLLVAVVLLPGVSLGVGGVVIATCVFALVQSLASPLVTKLSTQNAAAVLSGIGLVSNLLGLLRRGYHVAVLVWARRRHDRYFHLEWLGPSKIEGPGPMRVVVIGGGPAGVTAALHAAGLGVRPKRRLWSSLAPEIPDSPVFTCAPIAFTNTAAATVS